MNTTGWISTVLAIVLGTIFTLGINAYDTKSLALPSSKDNLSGVYRLVGVEHDGRKYYGACVVSHKGDRLSFTWSGIGTTTVGIGVIKDGVVAVGWNPISGGLGSTLYKVDSKTKKMHGIWTSADNAAIRTETLIYLCRMEDEET